MGKRKFRLPGVEELSKDQERVLRLPRDGKHLVVGGPGTGKSVVALLRAMKYAKDKDYFFVTYNKVLLAATKQLVDIRLKSNTILSWFCKTYYALFEELLPNIKPFVPDYAEIIERLEELDCEQKTMHLIIDEGQDMPPKFYESLMVMGIKNVFVVADQNQQITDHNSSRKELALLLNKRNSEVVELNKNYRNSYPIAKLAAHFYSDISSPPPGLPKPSAIDIDTPVLFNGNRLESFIKKILIEADMYPDRLIGVVVAKDEIREIWHSELINNDIERDNPKPNINTYSHNRKNPEIDFGEGGIVVLNDASVKGLEFDTVYVILEGFKIFNNDEISIRKRFYVITSRAIEKLVFFDNKDKPNPAASILPKDENILKREVV